MSLHYLRVGLLLTLGASICSPAFAQDEGAKRRALLPSIRAATDCVANQVRINPTALGQARYQQWGQAFTTAMAYDRCLPQLKQVAAMHDYLHGPGTGSVFVTGAYAADLPRAVGGRLRADIDRFIQAEAAEFVRKQREAEARQVEVRRQEANAKQESDAQTALIKDAIGAFYECVDKGVVALSAATIEPAETIVNVAVTKCDDLKQKAITTGVAVGAGNRLEVTAVFNEGFEKKRSILVADIVSARALANLSSGQTGKQSPAPQDAPVGVPASRQY
ncbi:hypothetical protein ACERNI_06550 [Camelimonas sp. ID_303_24]